MILRDLDIAKGVIELVGFFIIKWEDSRLDWSSNPTYNSINYTFSTGKYTWYPPLVLFNSVDEVKMLMDPDNQNPIRIDQTGTCEYSSLDLMELNCNTDATYYPFDTQYCSFDVAAWGYANTELEFKFTKPTVYLSFFQENGEWEFTDHTAYKRFIQKGHRILPMAAIELEFKRRPLYMALHIFVPTIMLGILIVVAFKVPPESGERLGYTLTTLLAYAVYLTMVSEHLPAVSLNIAYITTYLNITLVVGGLVVVLSTLGLICFHKSEEEPVPQWMVRVHEGWIGKLAGVKRIHLPCCKSKDGNAVDTLDNSSNISADDHKGEVKDIKWPDITRLMDMLFFRVLMFMTILQQIVFFSMCLSNF
ncbi:neuronal acetylcholine receptor subunit alpha-7-like [Saccostrea cucullata]|uniref:neuronal acetylcholine receptor subunit alpha-7-like n=1 Tax=Saccostrea cuccullata TaxID=36930 RepID=UPI002ED5A78E